MFVSTGNGVSLGQHSWGNIFPKVGVGGCLLRYFEPLHLKTVGDIKTNMAVLDRLRPIFYCVMPVEKFAAASTAAER